MLIIIANVIAWPLSYLYMKDYLQGFIFRVGVGIGTFALTGLIALVMALLFAGYQAYKAAGANPVDTLRHE
ncbi:MAG: hypothetical protein GY839_03790 [candidate division Zixibacteria bacterium]|nr:hypothetical protein [candidate division Zixibacteria bacterium]